MNTEDGTFSQKQMLCHNCRFDVTNIEIKKINNKCPRCSCGMFDGLIPESWREQRRSGDNSPDVRGKPLIS